MNIPRINKVHGVPSSLTQNSTVPSHIQTPDTLVTIYDFPTFEPLNIVHYPRTHLHLPLRRDILHKAVVHEGDKTRQGTAHTITRREARGSKKKLVPQKGQGRARAGDRSSPIRTTGVKVHGPKHRDFSTRLPRKMYDLAWRTALSWRYRKGELVVVHQIATGRQLPEAKIEIAKTVETFNGTALGSATNPRKGPRTLWILEKDAEENDPFRAALDTWYPKDVVRSVENVDCKNLLEGKRIVIEKKALDSILKIRQRDLRKPIDVAKRRELATIGAEAMAKAVAETKAIAETLRKTTEEDKKRLEAAVAATASGEATAESLAVKEL